MVTIIERQDTITITTPDVKALKEIRSIHLRNQNLLVKESIISIRIQTFVTIKDAAGITILIKGGNVGRMKEEHAKYVGDEYFLSKIVALLIGHQTRRRAWICNTRVKEGFDPRICLPQY